ncbi:MAG TPA: hypothetical protein IGR89_11965 [Oscillatoriaceae cyanobacterium M7585_C2015_266]|nr:hypothetical protein [Oscillatoriaceae cyanobacterium M7585_C2015_266]
MASPQIFAGERNSSLLSGQLRATGASLSAPLPTDKAGNFLLRLPEAIQ